MKKEKKERREINKKKSVDCIVVIVIQTRMETTNR